MRTTIVALAMALAACSSQPDAPAPADPRALAGSAAGKVMAAAPQSLGGGVEITGAKAEERTLVLSLSGMDDWRGSYSDEAMATTMKRAICFLPDVDALTRAGGTVRLQSRTPQNVALPPLTIRAC